MCVFTCVSKILACSESGCSFINVSVCTSFTLSRFIARVLQEYFHLFNKISIFVSLSRYNIAERLSVELKLSNLQKTSCFLGHNSLSVGQL